MTRLVVGLEARGLLARSGDDTDARSSIVQITDEGRALLAGVARGSNDYLLRRLEALDGDDLRRVLAAIDALTTLAERE